MFDHLAMRREASGCRSKGLAMSLRTGNQKGV